MIEFFDGPTRKGIGDCALLRVSECSSVSIDQEYAMSNLQAAPAVDALRTDHAATSQGKAVKHPTVASPYVYAPLRSHRRVVEVGTRVCRPRLIVSRYRLVQLTLQCADRVGDRCPLLSRTQRGAANPFHILRT